MVVSYAIRLHPPPESIYDIESFEIKAQDGQAYDLTRLKKIAYLHYLSEHGRFPGSSLNIVILGIIDI